MKNKPFNNKTIQPAYASAKAGQAGNGSNWLKLTTKDKFLNGSYCKFDLSNSLQGNEKAGNTHYRWPARIVRRALADGKTGKFSGSFRYIYNH